MPLPAILLLIVMAMGGLFMWKQSRENARGRTPDNLTKGTVVSVRQETQQSNSGGGPLLQILTAVPDGNYTRNVESHDIVDFANIPRPGDQVYVYLDPGNPSFAQYAGLAGNVEANNAN